MTLNIEALYAITEELKGTSKKYDKIRILKENIDNLELKTFIKYVFDKLLVYGIQEKKLSKYLGKTNNQSEFNNLFELFEYLKVNNTGRDVDAQKVAEFIDTYSNGDEKLVEFYKKSITKNLKLGIDKTINDVFGKGFVSEFNVQLAKNYHDEVKKVEGKEFVLTEKLDGQRLCIIYHEGKIQAFTRAGQLVTGLVEIEDEIETLQEGVYDGELLIENEHLYKDRDVLQKTLKLSKKDGVKVGLKFWVFDYMTYDEFQNGKSNKVYKVRQVNNPLNNVELPHVKLLPILYQGKDLEVIPVLLSELEEQGKEGLMLNLCNSFYVTKRTDGLLKIKSMRTVDEFVIDVFEGEGKYKGKLGGLIVNYKGYKLKVGSGFTDEERELYWNNPELIVGKIVEIQYFRESQNEKGGLSVSFPIFKGIRNDKSEPSYY